MNNKSKQVETLTPALPNSDDRVPTVMIPTSDNSTMMAFPWSQLQQQQQAHIIESQQEARDLLHWSDDIGTLDGCDLRFKVNQFGCLELLDSDDEDNDVNLQQQIKQQIQHQKYIQQQLQRQQAQQHQQQQKNRKQANKSKSSSGVSLLRDGPLDPRRPKSNHATPRSATTPTPTIKGDPNEVILDKLVPKDKVEKLKADVNKWTAQDVKRFIDSIPGCSGLGDKFVSHEICGESLMHLNQKDLLEIIDVRLGPAVKIQNAILLLKS